MSDPTLASTSAADMSPQTTPSVVAVVTNTNPIAMWHVVVAPDYGSDRLSGAWLIDPAADTAPETLRSVLSGQALLLVSGQVGDQDDVVKQCVRDCDVPIVDCAATVQGIRDHIVELKAQVAEEKAKPGREKLTDPRFPKIGDVEPIAFAHAGTPEAAEALAWARGLEELVRQWGEVESQRRRRKFLVEQWGKNSRKLPLVFAG